MNTRGFTLLELSIVLVIIGLIVGGVLVGQDLIRAAEVRAQVSQFEKITAAMYTFRTKYYAMPGDILAADASAYGMATRTGNDGQGDGDQLLEVCGGATQTVFGCETALFWTDLSSAQLIDGGFTAAAAVAGAGAGLVQVAGGQQDLYFPKAKIGNGNYIAMFQIYPASTPSCYLGYLCYSLTRIISTDASGVFTTAAGISPLQAYAIDSKIDDGMPMSVKGNVSASNDASSLALFPVPGACTASGNYSSNETYALSGSNSTSPGCYLNVKAL